MAFTFVLAMLDECTKRIELGTGSPRNLVIENFPTEILVLDKKMGGIVARGDNMSRTQSRF